MSQPGSKTPADLVDRKAADRWLTKVQVSLEAGDLAAVAEKLATGVNSYLLTRFRERKLILRVPIEVRTAAAEIFRAAAECLDLAERHAFDGYLRFSLTVDAARGRALERVHSQLLQMPRCSKADLLAVGEMVFDWYAAKVVKGVDVYSVGASVAERERRLHNLNGALNDVAFAVARAINESSRIAMIETEKRLSREERRHAVQVLRNVVKSAGEVNSFEWFFDSVSYGDLVIEAHTESPLPSFRLQFADARRNLLRQLAIRRTLVLLSAHRRERRYVREKLEETQQAVLSQAFDHYLSQAGLPKLADGDMARALEAAARSLALVDAEDDLLFAASRSDPKVAVHYVVAMSMRWYTVAACAVRGVTRRDARRMLASPAIPLAEIAAHIDDGAAGSWIALALANLTSELPARSHFVLMNKPFVRDGLHVVRPLLGGDIGTWNVAIREALIQGGALGKDVGATWEDFYAGTFADSEWKVVGRGVKLKRGSQILTDVDLLLVREDLLLVVQIKALIGSGNTVYEHWKNRQVIESGCSQGRIAAEFLDSNLFALVSICGKRLAAQIKHVQPVVLTNVNHFDGWTFGDVPVIGEATRKAICRGGKG